MPDVRPTPKVTLAERRLRKGGGLMFLLVGIILFGIGAALEIRDRLLAQMASALPYTVMTLGFLVAILGLRVYHTAARTRLAILDGRCATCGYDLTGNVSGVCPECGSKLK